jgi:hypothetical protein
MIHFDGKKKKRNGGIKGPSKIVYVPRAHVQSIKCAHAIAITYVRYD